MSPTSLLGEHQELISDGLRKTRIKNQGLTNVAEWKAHPATASKTTSDFHQWNDCRQIPFVEKLQIKRLMFVCLVKHLRPAAGMKAVALRVGSDHAIPFRAVGGIEYSHPQRPTVLVSVSSKEV